MSFLGSPFLVVFWHFPDAYFKQQGISGYCKVKPRSKRDLRVGKSQNTSLLVAIVIVDCGEGPGMCDHGDAQGIASSSCPSNIVCLLSGLFLGRYGPL